MRILKLWLPVLLWAGLILYAASDTFSAENSGGFLKMIFGEDVPHWLHVIVRKSSHLVVYGILAALTWRADRRWWVVLSIALAVAIADESLQSRSVRRTGSIVDVGIDVIGAAIAWTALQSPRFKTSDKEP